MIRNTALALLAVLLLSSCVYTGRYDTSSLQRLGSAGDVVVSLDAARLRQSDAAYLLDGFGEAAERVDRISLAAGEDGITGIANGLLSSTEVGTLLIWDPSFRRAEGLPRHYVDKERGISAGVPEDGIVLFTTGNYAEMQRSAFRSGPIYMPDWAYEAIVASLGGLYAQSPTSLPLPGLEIPDETLSRIEEAIILLSEGDGCFVLSGTVMMDSEQGARTLCTLLRNMLVQEIRRSGERLDVKALSGIFTYEGSIMRISGFELDYDKVSEMLPKEF